MESLDPTLLLIQDAKRHFLDMLNDYGVVIALLSVEQQANLAHDIHQVLVVGDTHQSWDSTEFQSDVALKLINVLYEYGPIGEYLNVRPEDYDSIHNYRSVGRLSDNAFKKAYEQVALNQQQLETERKLKNAHYYRVLKKLSAQTK